MHFSAFVLALTMAAGSVSGVTIRNFRNTSCKGTTYKQCSGILPWQCCSGGPTSSGVVSSSEFMGMPPTALGSICKAKGATNCGEVAHSGSGSRFCIGAANCRGSLWMDCNYCSKRDLASGNGIPKELQGLSAESSVEPDTVAFDDHQFKFDDSVPADVKQKFNDLFEAEASYADIPEELRQYELKGSERRGLDDLEELEASGQFE
ncbi:hypothetical protein F4813DRAFT_400717 [Daldinia decipiens]|uniref:uncharacterized protein n=1 Tax=Daldinia decipiens TaxID=326647 RepID=UPI0020C26456|nr:uncharacterized protein F4813DRAFT_400717 [Daldinia decipiens]KAI1660582.1 hypothetical protein F4813DRAFT_400717 [Daldinia decipiens]